MTRIIYRLLNVIILICLLAACGSDELEQQITALTTERDALKEEVDKVKADMNSTVTELTGKLQTLENERAELATAHEKRLSELAVVHEEQLKTTGAKSKVAQENLVGLGISLSVASAKINDLEKELQKLRVGKSLLGARLADAHIDRLSMRNQMQMLKASKSLVGAALSRTTLATAGIEDELQLARSLRSRLGATLADNRITQDALENRLDTMQALRSNLGARLADNRRQQDNLEDDLATIKGLRSRLGAKLADHRLQRDAVEDQLATTRALRSRLGAYLAEADLKQQSTEGHMHQVNWERDKALDQWQAVQTQLVKTSLQHTDMLNKQRADMGSKLQTLQDQLSDSAATIEKLDSEKSELVMRMAGAAEARDSALAQWKILHDRIDELTQKVQALETKTQ